MALPLTANPGILDLPAAVSMSAAEALYFVFPWLVGALALVAAAIVVGRYRRWSMFSVTVYAVCGVLLTVILALVGAESDHRQNGIERSSSAAEAYTVDVAEWLDAEYAISVTAEQAHNAVDHDEAIPTIVDGRIVPISVFAVDGELAAAHADGTLLPPAVRG